MWCIGEGRSVGTIQLVDWPETQSTNQTIPTNSTINPTQQSNLSLVQNPSTLPAVIKDPTAPPQNANMTLRILLTGTAIPAFDVYLLVLAVIVDVAPLAATLPVQTYRSPRIAADIGIDFEAPTSARTRAPFFEVQWLISAVALIPEHMIKKGRFQEAHAFVEVDGVRVADGFLGFSQDGGGGAGVRGNVSVE